MAARSGLCFLLMILGPTLWAAGTDGSQTVERPGSILVVEQLRDAQRMPELPPARSAGRDVSAVRLRMPLLASDWWVTTAYVDLDPTDGLLDWDCRAYTYAGHNGNDLAVRDFIDQDEGRFVVAAATGVVLSTHDGEFDRETNPGPSAVGNQVVLEHADGTRTLYGHLRKWSIPVAVGDRVLEGQPLGLLGSSGQSGGPHVHFGVQVEGQDVEPYSGPCNPGDSLWRNQLPHALDAPLTAYLTGFSTVDPVPGRAYLSRPPDVLHVKQEVSGTTVYFWTRLFSLHPGDVLRMIYRDPDGAAFDDRTLPIGISDGQVTARWTTLLPSSGGLGTWTIELQVNGEQAAARSFVYDAVDYQDPVADGRTVPVVGGAAAGDLRGSDADSGIKEFRIVDQPDHGGTVFLSGPRQARFDYTAPSGLDGVERFTFEVEDAQGQVSAPAPMWMQVSPVVANVLRLNGEDDHVAIPDNGSLNLADGMTLEAWIRRTRGSADWNVLFDRRNPTNETGFSLASQPEGTLRFSVGDGTSATFAYGTTLIPMDQWTHVAATWDGSMLRIYVNDLLEPNPVPYGGTISYPGSYETWLGRSRTPGNSFRGEIDEMRIWSEARSAEQLRQDATCSFHDGPPPATLVGWWRFDGNAQDMSASASHGSLVAPAYFRATDGAFGACAALDADLDGIMDDVDNCVLATNTDQADADEDGSGDACDLCPSLYDPREYDADRDGVADACDLCPFRGDTDQTDTDGDGSGDLCDPDPGNPSAGVPPAITSLTLEHDVTSDETTLSWAPVPHAVSYRVLRGTLEELRARHYGACISGGDPDDTDTSFVDIETPPPGELATYLVVGIGTSDSPGRVALDSDGRMRDLRAKDCL